MGLDVGLGLAETGDAVAFFPLATLFQDGDALEALEDVAFDDDAGGTLEAFMLGHGFVKWRVGAKLKGHVSRERAAHDKYFSPTCLAGTTIHSGVS